MNKITELLTQRRVWAGIVAAATVILGWLGYDLIPDPSGLSDILTNFGVALAQAIESGGALVAGGLAVWSYFNPKK